MAKIGLVVSGGMAKGAYQVGALKALSEFTAKEQIVAISAASVGSLNAYSFSSDTFSQAEELWLSINDRDDKIFIRSFIEDENYQKCIKKISSAKTMCNHFFIPLFDYRNRKLLYKRVAGENADQTEELLRAATSFIPFCKPVQIGETRYFDGAVIDNIPVFPLRMFEKDLDYIVCIYFDRFNYLFENKRFDKKIIKVIVDEEDFLLSKSLWFTRDNTEKMIHDGYEKAKAIFRFVFAGGTEDLEQIYYGIEKSNILYPKNQIRLTGDVVINNINKTVQRIIRRKTE